MDIVHQIQKLGIDRKKCVRKSKPLCESIVSKYAIVPKDGNFSLKMGH